jgi:hypothetical protein
MKQLKKVLDALAADVIRAAEAELERPRVLGYTKTKPTANKVASGTLKKSLKATVRVGDTTSQVEFGASVDYAKQVEEGTTAGTLVPIKDLIDWIRAKPVDVAWASGGELQAAFLFQKHIQQRGIPGAFYYRTAVDAVLPKYRKQLADSFGKDSISIF